MTPPVTESKPAAATVTASVLIADPPLRAALLAELEKMPHGLTFLNRGDNSALMDGETMLATIRDARPGIVFVGLDGLPCDAVSILARIGALDPAPRVVAVSNRAEPEAILKVMRAGATEFLYPPFESSFRESIERLVTGCLRHSAGARAAGLVLGFISVKGGCGATTLACHTARHLRRNFGKDVLLADLDSSSGIVGMLMETAPRYSLADALENLQRLDSRLWKALVSTSPAGVDVIPPPAASTQPLGAVQVVPLTHFWRTQYDFTILDFGHGIPPSLPGALESLDALVLTATHELIALRKANEMIRALAAAGSTGERLKLVINRMPRRPELPQAELEQLMGHPIFQTIPNDYRALSDAYRESHLVEAGSALGIAFARLADALAGQSARVENAQTAKSRGFFTFRKEK